MPAAVNGELLAYFLTLSYVLTRRADYLQPSLRPYLIPARQAPPQ